MTCYNCNTYLKIKRHVLMSVSFKGCLQKITWEQARSQVADVNPDFCKIIDELNPDDSHWLVKVTYPYGSMVMNRSVLAIPNNIGDIVPITDATIDPKIREGIGYNLNSNPVSIVLKNSFEIYLPLSDRTIPLSGLIEPGTAFGAWRMLNPSHTEQPVFIWDMTAGARSVFMLPKITEGLKHKKLEKAFGITANIPRSLMNHWEVFRQLANSDTINTERWDSEILFFSKAWFNHLKDKAWNNFYQYFYKSGWAGTEYWRNQPMWNLIFSLVLKEYEAKPNANIMDTAQYLLNMGVGAFTGLGPARNTLSGPWNLIQDAYSEVYEIKNYPPIIIQPQTFNMHDQNSPAVYYSLQFPNATQFKPSTRIKVSIISDLHEIRSLMRRYERDLLDDKYNLGGTSLFDLFKKVQYDYFHNAVELHEGMKYTSEMSADTYLRTTVDGKVHNSFPASCLFGRGCIKLSHKE